MPLLFKRNPFHLRRLATQSKPLLLSRTQRHSTAAHAILTRKADTIAPGSNPHRPAKLTRILQVARPCSTISAIIAIQARDPAIEVIGFHIAHATIHSRVAIVVGHVDVVNDRRIVVAIIPVVAATPPPVVGLIRSKRNPANIAPAKSDPATAASKSHKANQRRRPVIIRIRSTRPPAPAPGIVKPASVVIRSPAPGVLTHPTPPIPVEPGPAAHPVRSPARIHTRPPYISIRRTVYPVAIAVKLLTAINTLRQITLASRRRQLLIAAPVPSIPAIHRQLTRSLKARLPAILVADRNGLPATNPARTLRSIEVHFALPDRHFRRSVLKYLYAVFTLARRANARYRRVDVYLRL